MDASPTMPHEGDGQGLMDERDLAARWLAESAASLPPAPERPLLRARLAGDPFVWLLGYYAALVAASVLLVAYVPVVERAFLEPTLLPALRQGAEVLGGASGTAAPAVSTHADVVDRALTTLVVIIGALALVVPVARVYMQTKRLLFDPALIRSVIILPIVVAGIALVVKNSVALAFSLAGIVAAVRFRNTLKDPRDAVYIFLTIAIGLAAGVQALDVALVMSLVFNLVSLALWRFDIGSIYGGRYRRTGVLSLGDPALLVAQEPARQSEIRRSMLPGAEGEEADGILLVHSRAGDRARDTVAEAVSDHAGDWRLVRIVPRGQGFSTLEYLVRLKKKTTAAEMIGALGERWSSQVTAAEYIPFRVRDTDRAARGVDDDDDDDD